MPIFSEDRLARMRAVQEAHMQDLCVIRHYSPGTNTLNEDVVGFVEDSTATVCGLDLRSGSERHTDQFRLLEYDATLRLPIDTVVDSKDQIRVTSRFGETEEVPTVFEIVGPVQRGPSGIRLKLKKVAL